ncbi:glycosyltransferase [Helicobacter cetorum]|uniref:Lipopolysaccharide biosynthesis protein n=1 Tax=Helicobacter cetorum (strain ATCC BAA-429 / MIT 00-7128) TaxID=182217 RepID=I0EP69_HELC0|nr:glycosyltransferase [Helicobacter cetorum]AFI04738.1 lipopolysaccharide biosynthesis protein [Helicobacter cetorum MIT 00-7128]
MISTVITPPPEKTQQSELNEYSHIPIAFAFDKNYCIPFAACLQSFLECIARANKQVFYSLHALVVGLDEDDIQKLHQIAEPFKEMATLEIKNIEPFLDTIKNPFDESFTKRFSKMVLIKYFLADLFPKYSKIVWSDVDIIFCEEFSKDFLKITEDDKNYLYGVFDGKQHVLEGFLFCNLALQRKNHFTQKIQEILHAQEVTEEPHLTDWCWPYIGQLGIEYCVFPSYYILNQENELFLYERLYDNYSKHVQQALKNPIIIHYDGWIHAIKPWDNPLSMKANLWLNTLAKTPFFTDYTELLQKNTNFYGKIISKDYYFPYYASYTDTILKPLYLFFQNYSAYLKERVFCEEFYMRVIKIPLSKTLKRLKIHRALKKILLALKIIKSNAN